MARIWAVMVVFIPLLAQSLAQSAEEGPLDITQYKNNADITKDCGVTKKCHRIPEGCEGEQCEYIVTYKKRGDYVDFELAALVPDWDTPYMSMGINQDKQMTGASVTDCIMFDGKTHIQMAENGVFTSAPLSDPTLGLDTANSRGMLEDGFFKCQFSRLITVDGHDKIYDLASPNSYHLLLAKGQAASATEIAYHDTYKTITDIQLAFDWEPLPALAECGNTKQCRKDPPDCSGHDCQFILTHVRRGDYVMFELMTPVFTDPEFENFYVSMGINTESKMTGASVVDCVQFGGELNVQMASNGISVSNPLDDPTVGLDASHFRSEIVDGFFTCHFSRQRTVEGVAEIYDLAAPNMYYLIFAKGQAASLSEKAYHDTMKAKSTIQFDFDWGLDGATLTPEMVLDGCGKTKGCFLHPETCTGRECEYIVSYVSRGLYTDFEVSVSIAAELGENVYVGVGVNTHAQMSETSVVDCIHYNEDISVQLSHNTNYENNLLGEIDGALDATKTAGSFAEGFLTFRFSRLTDGSGTELVYNLTSPHKHYLVLAKGQMTDSTTKQYHGETRRVTSPTALDLSGPANDTSVLTPEMVLEGCGITKGCFRYPEDCQGRNCQYIVSYVARLEYIDFEVSVSVPDDLGEDIYAAIGFNTVREMSGTSAVDVIHYYWEMKVQFSHNVGKENYALTIDTGIDHVRTKGNLFEGFLSARFSRVAFFVGNDKIVDLRPPHKYYLIVAKGRATSLTEKVYHGEYKVISSETIDFNFTPGTSGPGPEDVLDGCGVTKGCWVEPDGCMGLGCMYIVSYVERQGYIDWEVSARYPHTFGENVYVSVGVNAIDTLDQTSWVDCIHYDGVLTLVFSHNTGNKNVIIENIKDTLDESKTEVNVANAYITVRFSRRAESTESDLIYPLTAPHRYHLLVAVGEALGKIDMANHHALDISVEKIDFAWPGPNLDSTLKGCGVVKGCTTDPLDCLDGNCNYVVSYVARDDEWVDFEVSIYAEGLGETFYVAVGLNNERQMSQAGVIDIIYDDGTVHFQHSYNDGRENFLQGNGQVGLDLSRSRWSFEDGFFTVTFSRRIIVTGHTYIYDLSPPNKYYLLVARGQASNSTHKLYHGTHHRFISDEKIDFTFGERKELTPETIQPGCGVYKGCVLSPSGCSGFDCDFIVTYLNANVEYTRFEVSVWIPESMGHDVYSALGFNLKPEMGGAHVIHAVLYGGILYVGLSKNVGKTNQNILVPDGTFLEGDSSYSFYNGHYTCTFSRRTVPVNGSSEDIFDLSPPNKYHILVARGIAEGPENKRYHGIDGRIVTGDPVNLASTEVIGQAQTGLNSKVKAHGILMIISWVLLAGFGILNARYYKSDLAKYTIINQTQTWFLFHRICMLVAVVFTIIGLILIFVHVQGWSYLIGATPSVTRAHPYFGIFIIILALANPIMAFFRPDKEGDNRPIFNWAHRIVGQSAFILAVFNVFLGLALPMVASAVPSWLIYVMVVYAVVHVIVEIVLFVIKERSDGKGSFSPGAAEKETGFTINQPSQMALGDIDGENGKPTNGEQATAFLPHDLPEKRSRASSSSSDSSTSSMNARSRVRIYILLFYVIFTLAVVLALIIGLAMS